MRLGVASSLAVLSAFVVVFSAQISTSNGAATESYQFQAEVSRLMDILIHSLYSNRDVFLRELISNANDAIDKIRFKSLTDPDVLSKKPDLDIHISVDEDAKTIVVRDTGIGMTKQDLISNLGTIAKSGTSSFLEKLSEDQKAGGVKTANLIGQFGVGFYSAFLVADTVTVVTKNNDDEKQWRWTSKANAGFTIREDDGEDLGRGTKIILQLREDAADYLERDRLLGLIHRYSEFIVFPIYMEIDGPVINDPHMKGFTTPSEDNVEDTLNLDEGAVNLDEEAEKVETDDEEKSSDEITHENKAEEVTEESESPKKNVEWKLVNDVKPLWTRDPAEITKEEYISFYKSISKTDEEPLSYIHFKAEGDVDFKGLLYIPKEPLRPLVDTSDDMAKKHLVKLYVKRVLVTDTIENGLLPSWLSFIVGIVDSDDLPINISRETLQQSKTLQTIQKKLLRKALEALKNLMEEKIREENMKEGETDVVPYTKFWKVYGPTIKMGLIMDMANRDRISKLVRFKSSKTNITDEGDLVTFDTYMDRMKQDQDYIYFHSGESLEAVKNSPFIEQLTDLGYEVLYFIDSVDEYLVQYYQDHQGTKLMSAAKDNFRLGADDDEIVRAKAKRGKKRIKHLLSFLKDTLGKDKVSSVRASMKLTRSPCALSTEQFGYTARMETVMRAQALSSPDKVNSMPKQKVMEINPYHPIILGLKDLIDKDSESQKAKDLANALYDAALITSGYYLYDHTDHGIRISRLMAERIGLDPNMTFEEPPIPAEDSTGDSEAVGDTDKTEDTVTLDDIDMVAESDEDLESTL
eukprot:Plantae.Rhodophyta-Purpureofilum_apyrenoidigerum.ctg9291.p1 GENE.Plantae.Rhodophyta-Purpureofilum_apyrenoidigerum.ctg9291~~Plantae.Rhodophyta-Purpureofilum_apyrenoidigerum.ctg9291.p1  ORF type:complete len:806 (-),score=212.83 Plantae.Rhodophyta-Purpureofilum_apyrenoidigerum.ctg9291:639-3056(-)